MYVLPLKNTTFQKHSLIQRKNNVLLDLMIANILVAEENN
jgi:hypothetical protein